MKKLILWIIIITGIIIVTGGVAVFAKDAPIFDIFFSDEVKDERVLNRMVKLYPETIGDYSLYSWGAEKIQKSAECENVNETLNRATGNIEIKGEICNRYTIGQYRMIGSDKVIFVHIYRLNKGAELFKNILLNMSSGDKLGQYSVIMPERHEIAWWVGSGVDYILTQEGTVKIESDGGQSMSYINKATGDNPVTQYFIEKYPPEKLSVEELNATCSDTDGENYDTQGDVDGYYYNPLKNETSRQKVKDVCVGDSSFVLQDIEGYIQAGILTKEQSTNKNILIEAYCSDGFIKMSTYECPNGCLNGACVNQEIIGGDKDEHGCLGPAGYSWCEVKQKCLRVWEEPCEADDGGSKCVLENCHGLDIKCGPNPPGACTMIYMVGDKCLQYARCGVQDGKCQQIENPQFTQCKRCVQKCIDDNINNGIDLLECEGKCN